jgi:hypothetical protein
MSIEVRSNGRRGLAGPKTTAACVERILREPVESLIARGAISPLPERGLGEVMLFATADVLALLRAMEARERELDRIWRGARA